MKTIKVKSYVEVPQYYTGIVVWYNGDTSWRKDGTYHREDGPAYIGASGYKSWHLDGEFIWNSSAKLNLVSKIILFFNVLTK
jgi:hypothetical protein